jgi:RHS repeat-associated protein
VKNPYRYRGYRYDSETVLYYLNSRYYNSEWGRFINADGYLGTPGELLTHNLFAYCSNNPVNRDDPNGEFFGALVAGVAAAIAIPVEIAAVVTVVAIVVASAAIYALLDIAVQEYRNNHVRYEDSSTPSDNASSTSSTGGGGDSGGSSPQPPKKPGKSTHGHHAYPKALGGAAAQKLIEIAPDLHRKLHSALYQFEEGWLAPKRGYTGDLIQRLYGAKEIQEGLARFYNNNEEFKIIIDTFNEAIKFAGK